MESNSLKSVKNDLLTNFKITFKQITLEREFKGYFAKCCFIYFYCFTMKGYQTLQI